VLLGYLTRSLAGQSFDEMETLRLVERDGETYVHYMRAIPTLDACLTCHGSDLAPEVAAKIAEVYPGDEATGFEVGDLRGAFSLLRPYDPERAPVARAPRLPELAEAPAEVPLGPPGKVGDPAAGRALFGRHCQSCHDATALAGHVFPQGAAARDDLCIFLQTHGLSEDARDCDILAYLKVLAGQAAQ
jgi:mono/diheme cytochrome c family protein